MDTVTLNLQHVWHNLCGLSEEFQNVVYDNDLAWGGDCKGAKQKEDLIKAIGLIGKAKQILRTVCTARDIQWIEDFKTKIRNEMREAAV